MISIELASGGSLEATSGSPSCAVTDSSTEVRSSVTTPPVVATNSPSSSISAISLLCAAALASTKSCWTFGSESALATTSSAPLRSAPEIGAASGASCGGSRSASSASTSTLSKIAVTMKVLREAWMSASWISCSLVVVQVSVSSSWRLAHSAKTETMPMIVASTIRISGRARRPVFFVFASAGLTGRPLAGSGQTSCPVSSGTPATATVPACPRWWYPHAAFLRDCHAVSERVSRGCRPRRRHRSAIRSCQPRRPGLVATANRPRPRGTTATTVPRSLRSACFRPTRHPFGDSSRSPIKRIPGV